MAATNEPGFPLPAWLMASETKLWEDGIPDAIGIVNDPKIGKNILIYAEQTTLSRYLADNGIRGVRPLAITDVPVMIAILKSKIKYGLQVVVHKQADGSQFEGDVNDVIEQLSANDLSR